MKDLLTSWKEIANYLGRTPRTVQRWEKEFHLPVHRPAHKQSRLVVADTDELDTWAIEHSNLDDDSTQGEAVEARSLSKEILQEIARKESSSTVFAALVDFIQDTLSCEFAQIALVDNRLRKLILAAGPRVPKVLASTNVFWSLGAGYGSCAAAVMQRKPVVAACIQSDPKWINLRQLAISNGISSCWAQPIIVNGNVIGVIGAYFKKRRRATYDQLTFLELMSYIAGIALQLSGITEPIDQFEKSSAFIGVDGDLRIRAINREASKLLDKSIGELAGQKLWEIYPQINPIVCREYKRALSENIAVAFETPSSLLGTRLTVLIRPSGDGLVVFFRQSTSNGSVAVA
jgi:hypothetical protein